MYNWKVANNNSKKTDSLKNSKLEESVLNMCLFLFLGVYTNPRKIAIWGMCYTGQQVCDHVIDSQPCIWPCCRRALQPARLRKANECHSLYLGAEEHASAGTHLFNRSILPITAPHSPGAHNESQCLPQWEVFALLPDHPRSSETEIDFASPLCPFS